MDTTWLMQIGFNHQDILLVLYSPLCAALGILVNGMRLEMDFLSLPSSGTLRDFLELIVIVKWFLGRIIIGCILGLAFALYFVGSLNESPASVARVLLLSMLIGYSVPWLWLLQEQHLLRKSEEQKPVPT